MNNQQYLKNAVSMARAAGPLFKKYFGHAGKTKMKNLDPRNLVTQIDLQIEKNIRKTIAKLYPLHKIIGEEFEKPKTLENDLVWIIDPIDGTTNYIQGIPLCCISIALWDKNGPLVGVLYNPVANEMFSACRGEGAFFNNKKIQVSKTRKLINALGGAGWLKPAQGIKLMKKILPDCRKLRVLATSAWQIGLVTKGAFDFYCTFDINIWDFAAGAIILQEAGGKITDILGNPITLSSKGVLASNRLLHNEIIKKLSQ